MYFKAKRSLNSVMSIVTLLLIHLGLGICTAQTDNVLDFVQYGHPTNAIEYWYDSLGIVKDSQRNIFKYNEQGRLTSHAEYLSSDYWGHLTTYSYDLQGRTTSKIVGFYSDKDTTHYMHSWKTEFTYDTSGSSTSTTDNYYLTYWQPASSYKTDVFKNEKGQIIKSDSYGNISGCKTNLVQQGYTEYKYKNDILDSTIEYGIHATCFSEVRDTFLLEIISYIDSSNYDITLPYSNTHYYYRTQYDSLQRKVLSWSIHNNDAPYIQRWQYSPNQMIWTRNKDKKITTYNDSGRVINVSNFILVDSVYTLRSEYNNLYNGNRIKEVSFTEYPNNNKRLQHKIVYGYTKMELFDHKSVDINDHPTIDTTLQMFTPNPSHGNIVIDDITQLDQLIITSSDGKSESLAISKNIHIDKSLGIYTLTFVYKNKEIKNTKLVLY